MGRLYHDKQYGVDIVEMLGGDLTFGTQWGIGQFDIESLISDAEIIADLPFVTGWRLVARSFELAKTENEGLVTWRVLGDLTSTTEKSLKKTEWLTRTGRARVLKEVARLVETLPVSQATVPLYIHRKLGWEGVVLGLG